MTTFTIEVKDDAVQALLHKLASRAGGLRPVLQALGEGIIERTKRRFETSTAPDGTKWKDNSATTLAMLADRLMGHRNKKGELSYKFRSKKDSLFNSVGDFNKTGSAKFSNKKPLIGESQELRKQFHLLATGESLTVSNSMAYAAMQQFGGTLGPTTWFPGKKIPARPFLPVHADGTLYPAEQAEVLQALNHYLMEGL